MFSSRSPSVSCSWASAIPATCFLILTRRLSFPLLALILCALRLPARRNRFASSVDLGSIGATWTLTLAGAGRRLSVARTESRSECEGESGLVTKVR